MPNLKWSSVIVGAVLVFVLMWFLNRNKTKTA